MQLSCVIHKTEDVWLRMQMFVTVLHVCPSSSPTVRTWVVACRSTPVRLSVPYTPFCSNSIPEYFQFNGSKALAMCEIKRGRWSYNCFDIFKINYSLFANDVDHRNIPVRTTKSCSHQTVLNLDIPSLMLFILHLPANHQIKQNKDTFHPGILFTTPPPTQIQCTLIAVFFRAGSNSSKSVL